MGEYKIFSSDGHVFEPADLWTERCEPRFRDSAPRIVRMPDGGDYWFSNTEMLVPAVTAGGELGYRFTDEGRQKLSLVATVESGRPGGWDPDEHIKDMDIDGITAEVIYPTAGQNAYRIQDAALMDDVCRAYNDWLTEFCLTHPKRLKGMGMLNLDDVSVGVRELERCAKLGLVGALITVYPPENKGYHLPQYEPLWATAEDLGLVLGMHLVSNRTHNYKYLIETDPSFATNVDHWVRRSLGQMLFSGVFQRYPKLRVGAVEMEAAWAIHFLQAMDYTYLQRPDRPDWYDNTEDMLPSDYFRRNVFVSFQEDPAAVRERHFIGDNTLCWGSDYPHQESTWPKSREILDEMLEHEGCTEDEKAAIAGENLARVYNVDLN